MAKQREIIRKLEAAGFVYIGQRGHLKFRKGNVTVMVPAHKDIGEGLAKRILREAGLR